MGFNWFISQVLQCSNELQQCQLIRQWLTVCPQLSVPFCTARRNYKAEQYAISRQLKTHRQQFSSLNSVCFVSVMSGTATSSVISFTFSAASRTVHKLYCTAIFSCASLHTQHSYTVHIETHQFTMKESYCIIVNIQTLQYILSLFTIILFMIPLGHNSM